MLKLIYLYITVIEPLHKTISMENSGKKEQNQIDKQLKYIHIFAV